MQFQSGEGQHISPWSQACLASHPWQVSVGLERFEQCSNFFIGPLLGGVFTDSESLTWRFCFWINLREMISRSAASPSSSAIAIGFFGGVLIAIFYKPPKTSRPANTSVMWIIKRLDLLGILLLITAFVCLTFALQWAEISFPWSNSHVWGCLLGFGLLASAFIVDQMWRKNE